MNIANISKDVDKFLVEVALAGASYGLADQVGVIYRYLSKTPARTAAPAHLAVGLSFTIRKEYDKAIMFLDVVIEREEFAKFAQEAHDFKAVTLKMKNDLVALKQQMAHVSAAFAKSLQQ